MCEVIRGEMCEGAKCVTRFKRGEMCEYHFKKHLRLFFWFQIGCFVFQIMRFLSYSPGISKPRISLFAVFQIMFHMETDFITGPKCYIAATVCYQKQTVYVNVSSEYFLTFGIKWFLLSFEKVTFMFTSLNQKILQNMITLAPIVRLKWRGGAIIVRRGGAINVLLLG